MASYPGISNILNFAVALNPTSAFPLDPRTMFGSYDAAVAAAATAENAGSTNTQFYFGQTLTVFENDIAKQYLIQGDKTLKEVGSSVATDDKTIVLNEGTLSLKDFGVKYYAYNEADTIIETGSYTYPDNMPTDADVGSYIKIADVWYVKNTDAWAVAETEPNTNSYYEEVTGWKSGLEPKVIGNVTDGFSIAWYEPSTTTVEGLSSAISTLQNSVEAMDARVVATETSTSKNAADIAAEISRADAAEKALDGRLTTAEGAITTLNADAQTDGSVANQVATAVAQIVSDAPEAYDTLKEIADWITNHKTDAATMNSSILSNQTAIQALETLVGTIPEGVTATTVMGYIAEAVKAETDRATAEESKLSDRITAIENSSANLGTAAQKDVEFFATAAQGTLAETAVQAVEKSDTNGNVKVDGSEVEVYTLPTMTDSVIGGAKVDNATVQVSADGVLSVKAVDSTIVTGLDQKINDAVSDGVDTAKQYTDDTAVAKSAVVTSTTIADTSETASVEKVVSEEALLDALTWKTEM